MTKQEKVLKALDHLFPNAKGELEADSSFQLLVAVVLSAQTTDIQVNKVTKVLFAKYPNPIDLANASYEDVSNIIKHIGLYKTKTKNIINLSKILIEKFDSLVPSSRKELESLPGVGRKTANVILSNVFNIPAIAVDTHVYRVSHRLGLSTGKTPLDVEVDLNKSFPKETWLKLHHQLIFFGRYHCKAKNPNCKTCPLVDICIYPDKNL